MHTVRLKLFYNAGTLANYVFVSMDERDVYTYFTCNIIVCQLLIDLFWLCQLQCYCI